jgi:hypothetical protein
LPQGELAGTTGFGYQNAGPYALRPRNLTGFPSALPANGAGAAECLRAFIGDRRPPVWIPRTHDRRDRRAVVLHSVRLPSATDNISVLYERYRHIVDLRTLTCAGALILRGHTERQLAEPFTSPTQLDRWQSAVNELLREGLFRHTGNDGSLES